MKKKNTSKAFSTEPAHLSTQLLTAMTIVTHLLSVLAECPTPGQGGGYSARLLAWQALALPSELLPAGEADKLTHMH